GRRHLPIGAQRADVGVPLAAGARRVPARARAAAVSAALGPLGVRGARAPGRTEGHAVAGDDVSGWGAWGAGEGAGGGGWAFPGALPRGCDAPTGDVRNDTPGVWC